MNYDMIKKALGTISKLTEDGLEYHFIYCGNGLLTSPVNVTKKIIEDFELESAIFTGLTMLKSHLVTKEMMEKYYDGKVLYKDEMDMFILYSLQEDQSHYEESAGDDLELFFMDLQNGKFKRQSDTFFLQKILPSERKMIEERSFHLRDHYLRSHEYVAMEKADVCKVEMDLSESNSKFIVYFCHRRTNRLYLKTRKQLIDSGSGLFNIS